MTGDDHAQRRHGGPLRPVRRGEPGRLLGRRLGVRPQHVVRLSRARRSRTRRPRPTRPQGFEIGCTSTRTARDCTPTSLDAILRDQLAQFAAAVPELAGAGHEPHALHRVERLGDAAQGRARARHPPGHELLLLAGRVGPGPARDVHRLRACPMRFADTRRHDDRRLPGHDADDRRVGIRRTRCTSTRCSTTRSGPQGYYGAFTANMHTDRRNHAGRGRDRRRSAGAQRTGRLRPCRCSSGSTAATARRSAPSRAPAAS